jgi:hypothetical protein
MLKCYIGKIKNKIQLRNFRVFLDLREDQINEQHEKLHNEESNFSTARSGKSRKLLWAGYVARMEETSNKYIILLRNLFWKPREDRRELRTTLRWIPRGQAVRMEIGCGCLRIASNGGPLWMAANGDARDGNNGGQGWTQSNDFVNAVKETLIF